MIEIDYKIICEIFKFIKTSKIWQNPKLEIF